MVNFSYLETILVHPTRRQIFAGKPDSTSYNICDLLVCGEKVFWQRLCLDPDVSKRFRNIEREIVKYYLTDFSSYGEGGYSRNLHPF